MEADPRVIVPVECSTDDRGEEVPRAFFVGGRRIEIVEVGPVGTTATSRFGVMTGHSTLCGTIRRPVSGRSPCSSSD